MSVYGPGGIVSLLLWGAALAALVVVIVAVTNIVRSKKDAQTTVDRDRNDSFEILKRRFARGEVSEEEYMRMRSVLL